MVLATGITLGDPGVMAEVGLKVGGDGLLATLSTRVSLRKLQSAKFAAAAKRAGDWPAGSCF